MSLHLSWKTRMGMAGLTLGGGLALVVLLSALLGAVTMTTMTMTMTTAIAAPPPERTAQGGPPVITKTVYPPGPVSYGDLLTYTLHISAPVGVSLGFYDPLAGTHFLRWGALPTITHLVHADGVLTGSLTVTPTTPVTVRFAVQVAAPGTLGGVTITNRACVYPITGTVTDCIWSEPVMNYATRMAWVYLPLALRNYEPIRADFTAFPTIGLAPLVVTFTNTSAGDYTHSLWRFGDGLTSTMTSPTHTYTTGGSYTVTLTVSHPNGPVVSPQNISTMTRPSYVTVYTTPPTPVNLQATPVSWSQIRLNWEDRSPVETGFTIHDGAIWVADVAADTISYTVGGLRPNSYHCFRVRAFNDYGPSGWSDWGCATTFPCVEGIVNGGFETDEAWEFPLTVRPATYTTAITRTGQRALQTGVLTASENAFSYSSAQQTISIPADAVSVTLRVWLYPITEESVQTATVPPMPLPPTLQAAMLADDRQYVIVLNEDDQWIGYLLWQRTNERAWVSHTFDLSAYTGQTIKLRFGVFNDGSDGVTAMMVDDVSLEICEATTHSGATHLTSASHLKKTKESDNGQ